MDKKELKIGLKQKYNMLNPKVYKVMLSLNAIFLFFVLFSVFTDASGLVGIIPAAIAANIILAIYMVCHCPRELLVCDGAVEFDDHVSSPPELTFLRVRGFWWVKVSYSVSEITEIEFCQNKIEKRFNTGHISFSGKATFFAKRNLHRVKERDRFVIYGIGNFSDFQKKFNEYYGKEIN